MNLKSAFILIILCVIVAYPLAANRSCKIQIININNKTVPLNAEIADTAELRETGLMNRKYLPVNNGMLFVFESERVLNFWMKNTHVPLSIAFADTNGIIIQISDMKPLDLSLTSSKLPARYALEVNQGWFKHNNIARGCKILLDGCFGK
jgi:hypothetical protein